MQDRALKSPPTADTKQIGFFGKLPSHGDFVSWGLAADLERQVQDWLQAGLKEAREQLGERWEASFKDMPPWRFIIEPGLWSAGALAGAVLPSCDRVGRNFPLVIIAQIADFREHPHQLYKDETWFTAVEAIAEGCIRRDMPLDEFTGNLQRLRKPRPVDPSEPGARPTQRQVPETLWWTVQPGTRHVRGFRNVGAPRPADLMTLIGAAAEHGVAETPQQHTLSATVASPAAAKPAMVPPLPAKPALTWTHAFATHAGTRDKLNADALLASKATGLFAVADGVGDAPAAAEAAKLAVHLLGQAVMEDGLEARLQEAKGKLGRANSLLQSRVRSEQDGASESASVIALLFAGHTFATLWAGDARCYLLRDGMLRCLTRDHVRVGMKRSLSRAVGLTPSFSPEWVMDDLEPEDRFLLCTAPLLRALPERAIAEIMLAEQPAALPGSLIENGLIADCRDNMTVLSIHVRSERDTY
ncbi:type VI secretion system-associated protein TagF [Rhizobium oryzicola]|uniref:Type VI secretion system-associated protein TagF n=1 Tax=Rhizobium oryzicola TaxID=1232668 RepID=A0ABT8SXL0_9HYPH|nr:type VI secretion system-associated protein TagF [Rhizobium oryzicola]MDO1583096.1 type VI secretion system-associated protein TagF [Rhizobium oryzicola]